MRRLLVPLAIVIALAGCSTNASSSQPSEPSEPPKPAPTVQFNKALHDELVGMLKRDQDERSGGPAGEGDRARTDRLKEIIEQYGWPTIDLVGKDGEDAAWAIAQHSDFDPAFQQKALELLRDAVANGRASPGNLAYLEDRVAVANGQPQVYGTQIRCSPDGPVPVTPIKDEAGVEERRKAAGLDTLADYLAEMAAICAQDAG
ncbi:MAG TPA: DUF6624 domain-containing protein [Micromonosporaceae bacterium]|nr:DUF6624 domain-containing protein [Micromonosporaceae bacterium]